MKTGTKGKIISANVCIYTFLLQEYDAL